MSGPRDERGDRTRAGRPERVIDVGDRRVLALADRDNKLARYRAALESGTDPEVIAAWITEVQGERFVAERLSPQATCELQSPNSVT